MAHFTLTVDPIHGPVISAFIGVSEQRATALNAAKVPVPSAIPIRALVDTGASNTCVDPSVLKALGLETKAPIYIATQGGTAKTVMDCAHNISKVSHVIISYLIQKSGWNLDPLGGSEE